jgi:hypothetical protein
MRRCGAFGPLLLLLLLSTASLTALAYGSSPDPVWTQGIFDDDDADNVFEFIVSATALVQAFTFHHAPPTPVITACPAPPPVVLPPSPARSSNPVRAPPPLVTLFA